MQPLAILNCLWATGCLFALWTLLLRSGSWRAGRAGVRQRQRLLALLILTGFLFPVISASDDAASWHLRNVQAQGATRPAPTSVRQAAVLAPGNSAIFWFLFNHLNRQAKPRLSPSRLASALPPSPEAFLVPLARPRHSTRGPPAPTRTPTA